MNSDNIIEKALNHEFLSIQEGIYLWENVPFGILADAAHKMRMNIHPNSYVTWIIDRNVNITNACISMCQFCNFCRPYKHVDVYITTIEQYIKKIDELFALGGNQLLLQGGMHPELGLSFYTSLFHELKKLFPKIKLHALGPPEIHFLAQKENLSYKQILQQLIEAGLDSLPGAGAEILSDRVRKEISPKKCSSSEWLGVMEIAHNLNLVTSATMMFGHIETIEERIEHLIKIRTLQQARPKAAKGFISFIPWPFQGENTVLSRKKRVKNNITNIDYIKTIALSRLMLPNIPNIQASWLTVGKETAQMCLYAGANDFGSIMIEENVVSVAGAKYNFNAEGMKAAITEAGFSPALRNQKFELL